MLGVTPENAVKVVDPDLNCAANQSPLVGTERACGGGYFVVVVLVSLNLNARGEKAKVGENKHKFNLRTKKEETTGTIHVFRR